MCQSASHLSISFNVIFSKLLTDILREHVSQLPKSLSTPTITFCTLSKMMNCSLQTTKQPLQTIILRSKVLNWKLQLAAQLAPLTNTPSNRNTHLKCTFISKAGNYSIDVSISSPWNISQHSLHATPFVVVITCALWINGAVADSLGILWRISQHGVPLHLVFLLVQAAFWQTVHG